MSESESKGLALHWKILIGLAVGAIGGLICNQLFGGSPWLKWFSENIANTIGQIFLRLIFMVVIPLVFCALTLGVAEIGDIRKLGRLGMVTLLMTLLFSGASVFIGVGLANVLKPGEQISEASREALKEQFATAAESKIDSAEKAKTVIETLLDFIPKNPLQEAVGAMDGSSPGSGLLGVMFFSLCFGVALTTIGDKAKPVVDFLEGTYAAVMAIIQAAMYLAPFGVAGLVFYTTTLMGFDILKLLAMYVTAVMSGLAIHMLVVYSLAIWFIAKRNPFKFYKDILEVLLTAFGTSSSSATLPTSLRVVDEKLGLNRKVSHFVLTIGATANQNGTALFEGITVLFLAQVFGQDLSFSQQMLVVFMSMLAGIGTAGVPGGSLPLIVLVLQSVGVPAEGIAIIMGVDRILDMSRTTVNVCGDIAIAACVDALEGKRLGDGGETEHLPAIS